MLQAAASDQSIHCLLLIQQFVNMSVGSVMDWFKQVILRDSVNMVGKVGNCGYFLLFYIFFYIDKVKVLGN